MLHCAARQSKLYHPLSVRGLESTDQSSANTTRSTSLLKSMLCMAICLVHLSDIHFVESANSIVPRLSALAGAVSGAETCVTDIVVLLVGDIANSGQEGEYGVAERFFSGLKRAISEHHPNASIRFLSVPGNHDCYLPEKERTVRDALIKAIQPTLQTAEPDAATIDALLEKQAAYKSFATSLCDLQFPTQTAQLRQTVVLDLPSGIVQFNLYNTALLSRRTEAKGDLSVPMELIRTGIAAREDCALSVSLLHHPVSYLHHEIAQTFRAHLETTSDIVLTGHLHVDHAFDKNTVAEEHIFYSEGDVLQDPLHVGNSGFRVILLDLSGQQRRVINFISKKALFHKDKDSGWWPYIRSTHLTDRLAPAAAFLRYLSDSGLGLLNDKHEPISLQTLFVCPDVTVRTLTNPTVVREISGDNLMAFLTDTPRAIIHGMARIGKTSLAKTITRQWVQSGRLFPLLLKGADIKDVEHDHIIRFISHEAISAYGEGADERYHQLLPAQRAVIIDDWDHSPLAGSQRDVFLRALADSFSHIVLFVNSQTFVEQLLASLNSADAISSFVDVSLKEMSYVSRGVLIDRWLTMTMVPGTPEYLRKLEDAERLVKTIIGKNTLPSLPFVVIVMLQAASQRNVEVLPENGSFGYLYEVLITTTLTASSSGNPQLDKKYTFLELLAYHMFRQNEQFLSEGALDEFIDKYAEDFDLVLDKEALLHDLAGARVLVNDSGGYSFPYVHFYYYFLARYFKYNLHGPQGKGLREYLNTLAGSVPAESNSMFLMFVMYLTHDDALTDELLNIAKAIMRSMPLADFSTEVAFYNADAPEETSNRLSETIDYEEKRLARRKALDSAALKSERRPQGLKGGKYSDDLELGEKFRYGLAYVDILGQILRNFSGSLLGDRKREILEVTCSLGLRVLRAGLLSLGELLKKAQEIVEKEKVSASGQDYSKEQRERLKLDKMIARFVFELSHVVGFSLIRTLSLSIGSPDIQRRAYRDTLNRLGNTDATDLINMALRLDHEDGFPYERVKGLVDRLRKQNPFAFRVLVNMVVDNLEVFDSGWDMRQKVASLIGVKAGPRLIGTGSRRFSKERKSEAR
jgi:hypothetical protein